MIVINRKLVILFVLLSGIFLILQSLKKSPARIISYELPFCPTLNNLALVESKNIKNERIAIVLAVDNNVDELDYALAKNTTRCYAQHYGYLFVLLNLTDVTVTQQCKQSDASFIVMENFIIHVNYRYFLNAIVQLQIGSQQINKTLITFFILMLIWEL